LFHAKQERYTQKLSSEKNFLKEAALPKTHLFRI